MTEARRKLDAVVERLRHVRESMTERDKVDTPGAMEELINDIAWFTPQRRAATSALLGGVE